MPKISQLTTGTDPDGTEIVPVVQSAQTVSLTVAQIAAGGSVIQKITGSTGVISTTTATAVVVRSAPSTTGLTLPNASQRGGRQLRVIDYSQTVTEHTITLTPSAAAQKVMRQSTWLLVSSESSLASITLWPIVDPDDAGNFVWVIAP